jgi:hypothetical protein
MCSTNTLDGWTAGPLEVAWAWGVDISVLIVPADGWMIMR